MQEESPASPTPIVGSGFSSSTGFGGFTGVTPPPAVDGDDDDKPPEEDCKAEFKPLVQLEEVEANTGEESEDCLLELCVSRVTQSAVQSGSVFAIYSIPLKEKLALYYFCSFVVVYWRCRCHVLRRFQGIVERCSHDFTVVKVFVAV